MANRASKDSDEHLRGKLLSFLAKVSVAFLGGLLATFVGGLLVFIVTQSCSAPTTPPVPPSPIPTTSATEAAIVVPSITPTIAGLPTRTLATPTPEHHDCPQRLDPIRGTPFIYLVRPGDTLSRLSNCFGVSLDDLASYNWIEAPIKLREGTYIVIPWAESIGGPAPVETLLSHEERVVIDAFSAMIADMFIHLPDESEISIVTSRGNTVAVQSALLWIQGALAPYNPATVLSATYDWNMPPAIVAPDFGWQPWQRGVYGTIAWRIQLRSDEGAHMELMLFQSSHYGLSALPMSPQVSRFETFTCRYPSVTVVTNAGD